MNNIVIFVLVLVVFCFGCTRKSVSPVTRDGLNTEIRK